jgi:hypothetical protein
MNKVLDIFSCHNDSSDVFNSALKADDNDFKPFNMAVMSGLLVRTLPELYDLGGDK